MSTFAILLMLFWTNAQAGELESLESPIAECKTCDEIVEEVLPHQVCKISTEEDHQTTPAVVEEHPAPKTIRVFLGAYVVIYVGACLIDKNFRTNKAKWFHLPLLAWSVACVFGWISVWAFLSPVLFAVYVWMLVFIN